MARDPVKNRAASARYAARHREKVLAAKRRRQAAWVKAHPEAKRARDAAYRAAHPDKVHAVTARWTQAHPEQKKASDRAWRAAHPAQCHKASRTYARKHPDIKRAQVRRYRKTHLEAHAVYESHRRAAKHAAPRNDLTPRQWAAIKAHYGHLCVYCGRHMQRLTQDHIIPLSKGGSHTLSNVVPACLSCNSTKGAGAPLVPVQPLLLIDMEE